MNISITSHFEKFVQDRVKAGRFNNASEVIRAGLRLLEREEKEYEEKLAALRAEIAKGFVGEPVPFNLEEIKAEARKRKNERTS
jgi:antitoxin ParD1/3/4